MTSREHRGLLSELSPSWLPPPCPAPRSFCFAVGTWTPAHRGLPFGLHRICKPRVSGQGWAGLGPRGAPLPPTRTPEGRRWTPRPPPPGPRSAAGWGWGWDGLSRSRGAWWGGRAHSLPLLQPLSLGWSRGGPDRPPVSRDGPGPARGCVCVCPSVYGSQVGQESQPTRSRLAFLPSGHGEASVLEKEPTGRDSDPLPPAPARPQPRGPAPAAQTRSLTQPRPRRWAGS